MLYEKLIDFLLEDASRRSDLSSGARLAAVVDAIRLKRLNGRNNTDFKRRLRAHLVEAARASSQDGRTRPFSLLEATARTSPVFIEPGGEFLDRECIRSELLHLIDQRAWDHVSALCRRLERYATEPRSSLSSISPMAAYAAWLARPHTGIHLIEKPEPAWQPPLVHKLSREAYNLLADFQAALDGQSYGDACRILTSLDPEKAVGLVPWAGEDQLYVSFSTAAKLAMEQHPGMAEELRSQHAARAMVRVRRAQAQGDDLTLRAATVHYLGTEAASEAHLWLGNRALSDGRFARAISHYRRVTPQDDIGRANVAARIRLAAAMLGEQWGTPVAQPVPLDEGQIAAADFEQLVAEMYETHRAPDGLIPIADARLREPLDAAAFEVKTHEKQVGLLGNWSNLRPSGVVDEDASVGNRTLVDWQASQLNVNCTEDRLFITNRFQMECYDHKRGTARWRTPISEGGANGQWWTHAPARPAWGGGKVFVRMIRSNGPHLVALDAESGAVVWKASRPSDSELPDPVLISNPMWITGQLFVLGLVSEHQSVVLHLVRVDAQTGELLETSPLVTLHETWRQHQACEATAIDEHILVNLGGATLCCRSDGSVNWLRHVAWLPTSVDPAWAYRNYEVPLVVGDRVLTAPTGSRTLQCLDLTTGRLHWKRLFPHLRSVIGHHAGRVFVETADGIGVVDATSGEVLWQRREPRLFPAWLWKGDDFMYARPKWSDEPPQDTLELVWIDSNNGNVQRTVQLESLSDQHLRFGPHLAARRPHLEHGRPRPAANRAAVGRVGAQVACVIPLRARRVTSLLLRE